MYKIIFTLFFLGGAITSMAQQPVPLPGLPAGMGGRINSARNQADTGGTGGGFQQRDDLKDSITISYRYMDELRRYTIDSSVNDFDRYFPVPSSYMYLGNNGAAASSLIFKPFTKAGWDPGFHAFDIYKFKLEETRFYKTTRPFSMIGYQLAAGKEQMVLAQHTQNIKPYFNAGFDYRLINAPGFFPNQNNNHNNARFFANYQGKRKRYNSFLVIQNNTIRASENGGIRNDSFLLNPNFKDRFGVDVFLGNTNKLNRNPFSTTILTGNTYKDFTFFLRQSYDVGQKDSVAINDSTTEYLFYPRLRLQHSITYNSLQYNFKDAVPEAPVYKQWYNILLPGAADTLQIGESWKMVENDFSLIQFPDAKNPGQFILAGASLQNINGMFRDGSENFYNLKLHGEYRNRTRNKKWDILLKGEFYLNGFNSGDYNATASLSRYLNKKLGDVQLFFLNTSRTPSFIFDKRSSFNLEKNSSTAKENIISFGATANTPLLQLSFANHLITNYAYFTSYYQSGQSSKLINVLQVSAAKKIKLSKRWNYYLDATFQQTDASAPIKVPLLYSRHRLAFEGNFYKNLFLSTGLEARYFTPYYAYNYSPLVGQFVPQDSIKLKNLPDVHAFLHFRIKTFTGFLRAENLNTVSFKNGFGFVNNNYATPYIPSPGMIIRFGVRWWFVN
ncbi:MAG: hypothetical protein EOO06_05705 [Chitinophagaceae bacterium]|nr:MAG: hypothetical protein EOO06_05705 [Chitinophagaceae bacterium]